MEFKLLLVCLLLIFYQYWLQSLTSETQASKLRKLLIRYMQSLILKHKMKKEIEKAKESEINKTVPLKPTQYESGTTTAGDGGLAAGCLFFIATLLVAIIKSCSEATN